MLEAEALALVDLGLFKDAAALIDSSPNPTKALKVLRVQLDSYIGNPVRSRQAAEALLREHLTPFEQAYCYEVIGRTAVGTGQIESGLKAMRSAMTAALRAQSPKLEARLIASNAELLLHWGALEPAAEEVSKLRRACVPAGDPYSVIAFHKLVAEIKAKMGLAAAARQSINAGRSLLVSWPNVAQQGFLAVTSSAIEFMQSDYETALQWSMEALRCAQKSGSREIQVPATGNLALIKLAQGKLGEAKNAVDDFLGLVRKGGSTEIAGLDTELEIAIANGELEHAQKLAQRVAHTSAALDKGNSYHGLWNLLTQVRLRYRLGNSEDGLATALEALPRVKRLADRNLLARMELLVAEGLGRTGQAIEGAALLAQVINSNSDPPLEMIAEAARVSGRLVALDDPDAALGHFERAVLIFEGIGHRTALSSVERDALETLPTTLSMRLIEGRGRPTGDAGQSDGNFQDTRPPTAAVAERIAALIELGAHPPLIGAEVLTLLISSGAVLDAQILHEPSSIVANKKVPYPTEQGPREYPHTVRILLGEHRQRNYAVVATPKPVAAARATVLSIERLVHFALELARARQEHREQAALWPEHTPEQELGLVCSSERMLDLIKTIRRVAPSNLTILITGETGVGKELFARALHMASPRKDRAFIPFNCTAVPKEMLDSQLFGHRRGAFTGAHEEGLGVIRAAAGGTLFLDEIGEMSADAQPKLLRFLESGEIHPLGEPKPTHVDVRIVAATNANLDQLVSEGKFREDLFYRLNVLPIHIPPLRERREEVPALVEYFLERFGREMQKPMLRVADETLEYLLLYRWPGNVRQLANEIRRMVALAEPGAMLTPAQLSKDIIASRRTIPIEPSEMVMRLDQPLADATEQLERAVIERALTSASGNNDQAAKLLGLSRKGLYLKRQRLGLK
jgi:hydrogenase-4 transcriptional activator